MPRVHPRCGTNLMALGGLFTIIFRHLPDVAPGTVLLALLFIFFFWRAFGNALQFFLTTKPATPRQIESGIKAGREILEKYQNQPHLLAPMAVRLLNSGILLSAAGMMSVAYPFYFLEGYLARLILR
jgi:hypothetical protein